MTDNDQKLFGRNPYQLVHRLTAQIKLSLEMRAFCECVFVGLLFNFCGFLGLLFGGQGLWDGTGATTWGLGALGARGVTPTSAAHFEGLPAWLGSKGGSHRAGYGWGHQVLGGTWCSLEGTFDPPAVMRWRVLGVGISAVSLVGETVEKGRQTRSESSDSSVPVTGVTDHRSKGTKQQKPQKPAITAKIVTAQSATNNLFALTKLVKQHVAPYVTPLIF